MHRLFRTDAYNTADRRTNGAVNRSMHEDELRILHGPKMPMRRKLLRNSPLPYEITYRDCDYRLLSLGRTNRNQFLPTFLHEISSSRWEKNCYRLPIRILYRDNCTRSEGSALEVLGKRSPRARRKIIRVRNKSWYPRAASRRLRCHAYAVGEREVHRGAGRREREMGKAQELRCGKDTQKLGETIT